MNSNTSFNKQIEEFLSLQDFWILCRSHSSWFGLSLAMFLLVAIYYLSITPDVYTCEASVLVKEETTQGTVTQSSNGNNFNNMALIQQPTNVPNVLRQYQSLACSPMWPTASIPSGQRARPKGWHWPYKVD